jgi:Phage integrase family
MPISFAASVTLIVRRWGDSPSFISPGWSQVQDVEDEERTSDDLSSCFGSRAVEGAPEEATGAPYAVGNGKARSGRFGFCDHEGKPFVPTQFSMAWLRQIRKFEGIPSVKFHCLRHTHASALIAAGLDVVKVSKRLGHASPTITLNVYAHLFNKNDDGAAQAIESAIGGKL